MDIYAGPFRRKGYGQTITAVIWIVGGILMTAFVLVVGALVWQTPAPAIIELIKPNVIGTFVKAPFVG